MELTLSKNRKTYLAPLVTHWRGQDLIANPYKDESVLLMPISNYELGAIDFSRMFPVPNESVYDEIDISPSSEETLDDKLYKILLRQQDYFIEENFDEIQKKADKLYMLATDKDTRKIFRPLTCSYKKMEKYMYDFDPANFINGNGNEKKRQHYYINFKIKHKIHFSNGIYIK